MSSRATVWLIAANGLGGMALLLGAGWIVQGPVEAPALRQAAPVMVALPPRPSGTMEAALQRPIFNAARRLPPQTPVTAEAELPPPDTSPPPTLVGLVASRAASLALFREADGTGAVIVKRGGTIGDWQLVRVSRSEAVLSRRGETVRLQLDPTRPGSATAAAGVKGIENETAEQAAGDTGQE